MNEFEMIRRYFNSQIINRHDVVMGIGDDCALLKPPAQHTLVVTTDTLVSGVHFLAGTDPYDIGFKSLSVNLSDIAAVGATPVWVTLALTLPDANEDWLKSFADGFFSLAKQFNIQLVGGDITRGALSITITAMGLLPDNLGMRRSYAQTGDLIYVTGQLAEGLLALKMLTNKIAVPAALHESLVKRLNRPQPKIEFAKDLVKIAHACIDISDGLAQDLNHILEQSKKAATLNVTSLPIANSARQILSATEAIEFALTGGDEYELCFTVPPTNKSQLEKISQLHNCPCTLIGNITTGTGLTLIQQDGSPYHANLTGFKHF